MSSITNFPTGVSSFGMPVIPGLTGFQTTGNVYFVDDSGSDTGSYGTSADTPVATLDFAIGRCTASQGDVIFVMPGHAETLTTLITADVAGITIIGLGQGDTRPTFTVNAAIPGINVTASNMTFINLRIISGGSATAATRLTRVAASNAKFINCQFETKHRIYHSHVVISGDDVQYQNCVFLNEYAPAAGTAGIKAQTALLNIGGQCSCKRMQVQRYDSVQV